MGKANSSRWNEDSLAAPFLAVSWGLIMSAVLLLAKPVWKSVETGTFPQGPEVATYLAERAQAGDKVLTDFITEQPLRYYLNRLGHFAKTDTLQSQSQRVWVILHRDGGLREERVTGKVRRLGAPPLSGNPAFESGSAAVYLLERIEGG